MGTVVGLTAEKGLEIEAAALKNGAFDEFGHLILTRGNDTTIDAGSATATIVDATDTVKGIVLLASDTETITGTDGTQAVTPLGLSALTSTATRRGLVELATSAETITGTDTSRAVTPADLFAVRVISVLAETAASTAYPPGTSVMPLTGAATAWSINSGIGTVITDNIDTTHCTQTFVNAAGGTQFPRSWVRTTHTSNGGGGWTAWAPVQIMANLTPGSFVQTTAFTSYPLGVSRLIYTSANSTSWGFAGYAGEVVTYVDGTNFARQTFTFHLGGSAIIPSGPWVRTATSGSGWTAWFISPKVLARRRRFTEKSGITTESGYLRLDDIPVIGGCAYRTSTSGLTLDSTADNEVMLARLRGEQSTSTGTPATASSTIITQLRNQAVANAQPDIVPMNGFWYPSASGFLSVILTGTRVTSLGTFRIYASATEPCELVVELVGTDPGDTGTDL
jgi:hypothetical protein